MKVAILQQAQSKRPIVLITFGGISTTAIGDHGGSFLQSILDLLGLMGV